MKKKQKKEEKKKKLYEAKMMLEFIYYCIKIFSLPNQAIVNLFAFQAFVSSSQSRHSVFYKE